MIAASVSSARSLTIGSRDARSWRTHSGGVPYSVVDPRIDVAHRKSVHGLRGISIRSDGILWVKLLSMRRLKIGVACSSALTTQELEIG
jgi:hypothetical protein